MQEHDSIWLDMHQQEEHTDDTHPAVLHAVDCVQPGPLCACEGALHLIHLGVTVAAMAGPARTAAAAAQCSQQGVVLLTAVWRVHADSMYQQ